MSSYPQEAFYDEKGKESSDATKNKAKKWKRFSRAVGVSQVLQACQQVQIPGKNKIDWEGCIAHIESEKQRYEQMLQHKKSKDEAVESSDSDASDQEDDPSVESSIKEASDKPDTFNNENRITLGLVGHPNVGKSSLVNSIMSRKVVSTSRTPGHTKHLQTLFLTRNIRLCDCPGIVFPSLLPKPLQIISGMYKISQVREPYSSIIYLAERLDLPSLLGLQLPQDASSWSAWTICEALAIKRGFLTTKAGRPDVYRAANLLLRMVNDGVKLLLYFRPPGFCISKEAKESPSKAYKRKSEFNQPDSEEKDEDVVLVNRYRLLQME